MAATECYRVVPKSLKCLRVLSTNLAGWADMKRWFFEVGGPVTRANLNYRGAFNFTISIQHTIIVPPKSRNYCHLSFKKLLLNSIV